MDLHETPNLKPPRGILGIPFGGHLDPGEAHFVLLGVPGFKKAKPIERWGRKATGLDVLVGPTAAVLACTQSTSRASGFGKESRAAKGSFQAAKEGIMAKYIALHTLKKSADEFMKAITAGSAGIAQAMAAGKTPARCLKTWNPIPHGRTDYVFCLWEADKAEDVVATLEQFKLQTI